MTTRNSLIALSTLFWVFGFAACENMDRGGSSDRGPAVAVVNGEPIPLARLMKRMGPKTSPERRKGILDALINEELVLQKAMEENFIEESDRIRAEIARAYAQSKAAKVKADATDEELRKSFEEKKDKLERVRASHILIKVPEDATADDRAKARKKAEDILAKVKKNPEKFAELAKEMSEDPRSKSRGGDLFWFNRSQKDPAFADATFALEDVGSISELVETKDGFHIVRLTGSQRGFDYFKQSFRWQVEAEKKKEVMKNFYEDLRKGANIQVKDDILAKAEKEVKPKTP